MFFMYSRACQQKKKKKKIQANFSLARFSIRFEAGLLRKKSPSVNIYTLFFIVFL